MSGTSMQPAVAPAPDAAQQIKPHINAAALEWVGRARQWVERAKAAGPITTAEEHERALAARKMIGEGGRQIETIRKEHTAPYRAAVEAVNDFFRGPAEDVAKAAQIQGDRIKAFEKAEAERRRLAEEQARREREAEARRLREEEARIAREREAAEREALERAQALEAAGRVDEADEVLEEVQQQLGELEAAQAAVATEAELVATAPVIAVPQLSTGGLRRTVRYSAKVVDLRALVQAWLDGKVPADMLGGDRVLEAITKQASGYARMQREGFAFPGCELVADTKIEG